MGVMFGAGVDTLDDVMMFGAGIDKFPGVMLVVDVDVLSGMEIIVVVNPAITLGFMVGVSYTVDMPDGVLINVLSVAKVGNVTDTNVSMLADDNVNVLAAAMTPLEPMPFC